jgi:hypothetical protein
VYVSYLLVPIHVMLSAIDSEMDRCFAELRMLNFGPKEEDISTDGAMKNFKDVLSKVVEKMCALKDLLSEVNTNLVAIAAVSALYNAINDVKKQIDLFSEPYARDWEFVKSIVSELKRNVGIIAGVFTLLNPNVNLICNAVALGLAHVDTFNVGRRVEVNEGNMLSLLKTVGDNLHRLKEEKDSFYKFLNDGVSIKTADQETPEKIMLAIIQTLSKAR